MELERFALASITLLALISISIGSSASPNYSNQISTALDNSKIDPVLADQLNREEELPVIVTLSGKGRLDLEEFKTKYAYRLINGLAGKASPSTIKKLADIDNVEKIYFDSFAEVKFPEENSSNVNYLIPAKDINADKLWEKGIDGKNITVAVIDSGIDDNHPDLANCVIGEKNFVEDESSVRDLLGHGTMVAGIIAGSGVSSGGKYKGIAPGAKLLNVKVVDRNGNGRMSDIIAGIEWALYNGADVLSLSLGGMNLGETNPPVTMAADKAMEAGAVVCVAAGNHNSTKPDGISQLGIKDLIDSNIKGDLAFINQVKKNEDKDLLLLLVPIVLAMPPSLIDSPGDGVRVITVGASDGKGNIGNFSGSGPIRDGRTKPTIVGPGVDVVSTIPPGLERPKYLDIYYARESGTSLSTPVAAGLAALLLQANPDLTPAGIKAALTRGAIKLNNTLGDQYEAYYQGAGRLDALKSYELIHQDLCGVEPDNWIAGRWAYLPAGKALYAGLDTGADRPQKKLYALAPQDEDWTSKFVFFTDKERNDLEISPSGEVSDWISLQPLPRNVPANGQKIFSSSITVPNGTLPGLYNGLLDIKEKGKIIFSIPIMVHVAEQIKMIKGRATIESALNDNKWRYYYLDVPLGTSNLKASLKWKNEAKLDLILLSPTSEYYPGVQKHHQAELKVEYPPSGRWLLAVHGENLPLQNNFTLDIERTFIESYPKRWFIDAATPGSIATMLFNVKNQGPLLDDIEYNGFLENITATDLQGSVTLKKIWDFTIDVQPGTNKLSATLDYNSENNDSQLLFLFENPTGDPVDAALGNGNLGPIEVNWPEPGKWKVRVYGHEIPKNVQEFNIKLFKYAKEEWDWISASGPAQLESDSNATIEASMKVPENSSANRLNGYIELANSNESFQIPVTIKLSGTSLGGLSYSKRLDNNSDNYYDRLFLGLNVNLTAPGDYKIEGTLVDCAGNQIERLSKKINMRENGTIEMDIVGSRIWKKGKCGPLHIIDLMLFNQRGELLDRFKGSIAMQMNPQEFQPPDAYLTRSFDNETTTNKISVEVGVHVIKAGRYELTARLEDDKGEEIGKDSVANNLLPGNATILIEFNPTKFMMLGRKSRLHLKDVILNLNGTELDCLDEAWSSNVMSPEEFRRGAKVQAVIRYENAKISSINA